MRKRDAIVLLLICGFVLLNAGALRTGGSMRAKLLMCTVNLQKIAQAVAPYADSCDGKMPLMTGAPNTPYSGTFMRAQWLLCELNPTSGQRWYALGCLFAAGYISDGRQFYCPAIEGSLDEYLSYSNPAPWGSNLDMQTPNMPGDGNIWLRTIKGYAYWPLKSNNCTQAEYNAIRNQPGGAVGFDLRYRVGYPLPAVKYVDLGMSKPMAFDFSIHATKSSGYTINVAYGDAHVELTQVPRQSATGKYLYPYQQDVGLPAEDKLPSGMPDPSKWVQVMMYDYTAVLQP
jgi:hypothetical protein